MLYKHKFVDRYRLNLDQIVAGMPDRNSLLQAFLEPFPSNFPS
jgi:hypothetical protein